MEQQNEAIPGGVCGGQEKFEQFFILKMGIFIEYLNTGGNDSVEREKLMMLREGRIAGEVFRIKEEGWDLVCTWRAWLLIKARTAHPLYQKRG